MKRLLIALVAAVAVSTGFAKLTYTQGFEGESYNPSTDFVPSVANEDASEIANHGTAPSVTVPYNFGGFGDKYYELDTGNATLWYTNEGSAPYFDMVMQFNPSATAPTLDAETKIAVYVNASSNLVVISGDGSGGRDINTYPSRQLSPGTWARLTIAATERENKFAVYLDNQKIGDFAPLTGDASINSIGFKGSGALDDFVARTTDPMYTRTTEVVGIGGETGGEYFTEVSDAAIEASALAKLPLTLYGNASFTATPAVGASFTIVKGEYELTGLDNDKYAVNGNTYTRVAVWSDYLDEAVAGAYEIDNLAELKAFQANVGVLATAGETFKLTADIALDTAWPGIGVKNGKDLVNHKSGTAQSVIDADLAKFEAGAFRGVFDGQNHTVSGFQMQGGNLDYCGFFNSTLGATISNLKIQYAGSLFAADTTSSTEECGAAFVGVAKTSTLQNLTTVAGTVSCGKGFGGIVGYLMAGSTVDSCTNNVNLTSLAPNKCGGIAMITQGGSGTATIRNCVNNGTTTGNATQQGGVVGYVGVATSIENCTVTAASEPTFLSLYSTVTVSGVNVAPATAKPCIDKDGNDKVVSGLTFATVDNGVATFVADNALAAGNTYKVMAPGAATYEFDAVGTIAFDTAVAVPASTNITADTTTLVLADPVTDGTVTTYAATAGVASVDDFAYSTFDEAVAALDGAEDDFVTLLADVAYEFSYDTTLKVKAGNHTFTANKAAADVVVTPTTVEGITTYVAVEGVAAWSPNGNVWNWRSSFEAAYNEASGGGSADLKVKINGDFAPSGISASKMFYTITFLYDAEDNNPATIVLTNGNYKVTATEKYSFPTNATLVLPADFTVKNANSFGASGVLNIPEGVKVTLSSYTRMNDLAGVTGAGTIDVASDPDLFIYYSENNLPKFLRAEGWKGVLEISGSYGYSREWNFADFGNPGSTIRFKGLTASYLDSSKEHAIGAVELVGDGFTFNGAPTANKDIVVSSAVRGFGALNVAATSKRTTFQFTGDVSDFTGNVTVSGTGRVAFGSNKAGTAPVIYVHQGASVTNTGTWTANEIMVTGELVANGTVTGTLKGLTGYAGVYRANASTAAIASDGSWNGTYYANFDSGNVRSAFDVATNASATTVINGANGVFSGFPRFGSAAPNVAGSVVLNANWTIGDGWATNKITDASNATTFANLSGGGNLTVNGTASGTDPIYYCITTLDGYTGALGGNRGAFVVGKVNVATQPTNGAIVVKTNIGVNGSINDNVPLYVGGTDTTKTLTYKADGAYGAGLYYFAPVATVSITVPAVENATATVTTNGVDVAGDGTYTVEEGVTVTITYAPNADYILSGTSVYTIESAAEGSTITITDTTVGAEIADVYRNDAKVAGYTSIRAAIAAAQAGDTVRLVADDTVSFEEVVVTERIPSGGSIVIDKNLTIDGGNYTVYGVSNAEILNATGSATPGLDMVADLVDGSNLIGFFVKSGNVTFNNITLTEFGDEAYVNKFGYTPIQTASAYAGSLVLTGVNFNKFNRTAVCVRGGTLTMTSGTVTANATHKDPNDHFQQPIEVRGGTATINGVNVTSDVVYSNGGGAIVAWGNATLTNVNVDFTGIGVWSDGPTVAIVGEDTSIEATGAALFAEEGGTINVSAGTFTGTLAVDSDPNSAISITGGTFDSDVNEYCASGYGAFIEDGVYVVSEAVTVTFSSAQGTAPAAQKIKKGTAVAKPADPTAEGYTFKGWTLNDAAYDFAMLVNEDITLVAQWEESQTDDWNTPASDEDVAESLDKDGITTDTEVVETVEEFNALVNYITNHVSGASAPADLSVNQKANAVLCFALNADTIPDKEITSADVTIDSVEKTGDAGAVAVTVSIAGVTPGESVPSTTLEKIVTAKGGTSLGSMSTENVTVSGLGTADGKVNITVTPKNVGSTPTSFFTSVIINK